MSAIDSRKETKFRAQNIKVKTGDGTMFVIVIEDDRGVPIAVQTTIGKAGSSVRAWCESVSRLTSLMLDKGSTLNDVIDELANITSDRHVMTRDRVQIRSGPEGFVYALRTYQREKRKKVIRLLSRA